MRIEEITQKALKLVKPSEREEERFRRFIDKAVEEVRKASSDVEGVVEISVEGSAAKNTWIRGREEVDIFVHFDPSVQKDSMEKEIIGVGFRAIKALGGKPRLMYAEHPYVEGVINGYTVDVVACYRVNPPNWLSATDRTPYHTRYVLEKLWRGGEDEVRLLKAFMIGCGVYGAEIKVKGFSGYLTELLTIGYGGFLKTLEAVKEWRPPIILDIEEHYPSSEDILKAFPNQSLVVVDPVDRGRNVAAAVSDTRLAELILASKLFLEKPSLNFFKPKEAKPSLRELRKLMRGRSFLAIFFRIRDERPPDVLWGELKRSEEGVKRGLERLGFHVYRSSSWSDERRCLILLELHSTTLPRTTLHKGPPTYLPTALEFLRKWGKKAAAGPWVDGLRLYALRRVEETRARRLLREEIKAGRIAISHGILEPVKRARIYDDLEKLLKIAGRSREILEFIAWFLRGRPPFLDE